jgi:hypothetical protein
MNTILSTLSTEDKNKSFVTIHKDGAYFDIKLSDILFNGLNIATGVTSATLNTQSGVVTFTENCEVAPAWKDYAINNSLITSTSIVNIMVTNNSGGFGFTSLVQWICTEGSIIISVNDGFNGAAAAPIVAFEILN